MAQHWVSCSASNCWKNAPDASCATDGGSAAAAGLGHGGRKPTKADTPNVPLGPVPSTRSQRAASPRHDASQEGNSLDLRVVDPARPRPVRSPRPSMLRSWPNHGARQCSSRIAACSRRVTSVTIFGRTRCLEPGGTSAPQPLTSSDPNYRRAGDRPRDAGLTVDAVSETYRATQTGTETLVLAGAPAAPSPRAPIIACEQLGRSGRIGSP